MAKEAKTRSILSVPVDQIILADNSRKEYHPQEMEELMVSMKQSGLLQPIGVDVLDNGKYKIVFGYRRLTAAKKLGWDTIDAVALNITDGYDAMIKNFIENIQRANVSMPEQGRLFSELMTKDFMTAGEIAARIGCSKQFVLNATDAFHSIPKKFRDKITHGTRGTMEKEGTLPITAALQIKAITSSNSLKKEESDQLYEWAMKEDIHSQNVKAAGRLIASGSDVKAAIARSSDLRTFTLTFSMQRKDVLNLENKFGRTIHEIAYSWLESSPDLQIMVGSKRHQKQQFDRSFSKATVRKKK